MLEILDETTLVEKMSINPRKIFNLAPAVIDKEEEAELTIWRKSTGYTFEAKDNKSLSKNSAFFGKEFKHEIVGIISKGSYVKH